MVIVVVGGSVGIKCNEVSFFSLFALLMNQFTIRFCRCEYPFS